MILGAFYVQFYAISHIFGAFNSCLEIGASYIPLLARGPMFSFNFLGCRTPQFFFALGLNPNWDKKERRYIFSLSYPNC